MMSRSTDHRGPEDRWSRARAALSALLARYRGGVREPGEQELIDGLFVDSGNETGWLTGISELSVSFRAGRPVTVRSLAEVLRRRPLDKQLATTGLRWGTEMLDRLASRASSSYAAPLFRQIYERLYLHDATGPAPLFRFGMALELGGGLPVLKVYFDLHAVAAEHRRPALDQIATLLGETAGLEAWKRACPEINLDTSRVIGVDFGAGDAVRTKFYWTARHLTWDAIAATSREISGERHLETLDRLSREVCAAPGALSSVLVSMCGVNGERSMKLDVCVARLYENDGLAYDAIERFRGRTLDTDGPAPFEIVSGGLEPGRTKCVQQYLGVELPPGRGSRVTLYYRPIGFETEHLNPVLRPRMCA